jgi:hypothetical protein
MGVACKNFYGDKNVKNVYMFFNRSHILKERKSWWILCFLPVLKVQVSYSNMESGEIPQGISGICCGSGGGV